MAAIAEHPNRNIALRQGASTTKRHDRAPRPDQAAKPRLPT
jgi:hypothetical protein